eukprot:COSAG01_NODE_40923_length_458_cov_0.579387_1_plen_133_part_01
MKTLMAIKKTYGDSQQTIGIFEHMSEFENVDQPLHREIEQAAKVLGVGAAASNRFHPLRRRPTQGLQPTQRDPEAFYGYRHLAADGNRGTLFDKKSRSVKLMNIAARRVTALYAHAGWSHPRSSATRRACARL